MGDPSENRNMEGTLLIKQNREGDHSSALTWQVFFQEVKKLGFIAGPMVAVILSQFLVHFISMTMVGHLDELALSSTAMAISLSSVTGLSPLMGMASALETLSGQAYGAKQYKKLGIQTQTAIFCLILVCIPLSVIWINMGKILIFIGQDPRISHEAGKFTMWLVPQLFAFATLQPLIRYFQTQSLIFPMVLSSCGALCFHIPLCWVLVFKSGLDNLGAAVAMCISNWLNVIILALYMKFASACAKTRAPISMELFHGIGEFFRFAIPSAVMICLEWWSFELLVLLSGLLPNPELETSILSVCLTTISTLYAIPYGFGAAASCGDNYSNCYPLRKPPHFRVCFQQRKGCGGLCHNYGSPALFVSNNGQLTRGAFRSCKGVRMAANRGVYKPGSLLSLWDSSCCSIGFHGEIKRNGALDWNTSRCIYTNGSACYCYRLHRLGKTGKQGKGKDV
ncbi:protein DETOXIFICATION 12 isoform X2 [Manihot esculenta]|uniref:Uncharacterized protein n=1 Tax=Manihot esculenta TaxID=3983 RepID=A0ACB7GKA2_MANES|nr:protein DETOXIFICATION 12 isoform X2 [Manihot esculenta]KAG8639176.1 hypothetical protein MANES_14G109766v8 [Manihot esculenta]